MKKGSYPSRLAYAAALSVTGFTLSSLDNKAHGSSYYLGTTAVTGGLIFSVGSVYFIMKYNGNLQASAGQTGEGELTRALIDAGLVGARGDLGMELSLLVESPTAFTQMNQAVNSGQGAPLLSLGRATGISSEELISSWKETATSVGPVDNEAKATQFVMKFLLKIGPSMDVDEPQLADFLWKLAVEEASISHESSRLTHQWVSGWLGIPSERVLAASRRTFHGESVADGDLRQQIHEDPELFMRILVSEIEAHDGPMIRQHADEMVLEAAQWLPEGTLELAVSSN